MQYYHVFIDESVRKSYAICAVWIVESDVNRVRRIVRSMCRPGQCRLHFTKEQDGRRREVLAKLAALPIHARIFVAHGPAAPARRWCLETFIREAVMEYPQRRAVRIVIESRFPGDDDWDRRMIYSELLRLDADLPYEHLHAFEEAMLWASDAIVWAYMAGGDWRNRLSGLIDKAVIAPR